MKYFFGFLASVGLIILVFILVLRGLSGGDEAKKTQIQLIDYANTDTAVQMTVDGRVTADQTHQGYRITIDRNEARIEVYKGYDNSIVDTKIYDNNQQAYATFLRALDLAGFTKGNDDPALGDERGVCPSGQRYILETLGDGTDSKRYWTTSCRGGGTYRGNLDATQNLFQNQIPDFESVTSHLVL